MTEALDAARSAIGPVSHNVYINGRCTSFRLDPLTWRCLHEIAQRERVTVHELCTAINKVKRRSLSFTAAVRMAVLKYYRQAATESGHAKVRHGTALH